MLTTRASLFGTPWNDHLDIMRRVLLVPVIHTSTDLGSLAEAIRARYLRRSGPASWDERQRAVETLWTVIRGKLDALRLDFHKVRVYQDGLPVCGHEVEIVRELAGAGSVNHQLILELVDRGAVLMGTEDPQLLIREYQMQRRQILPRDPGGVAEPSPTEDADELLTARDAFIAQRIADTLRDGETALLFAGAAHRADAMAALGLHVATLQ